MDSRVNFLSLQRISRWAFLPCMVSAALLVACGGSGGGDSTAATTTTTTATPTPAQATAVVRGRVLDATDGSAVVGATVTSGSATATSGADGSYTLNGVGAGDRVVIVAVSNNYAETVRVTSAAANTTASFNIKLLKVAYTTTISQTAGGVVSVPGSTAQVTLPGNFAVNASGGAPTGLVTVKVTPIDAATDSSLMPGDYTSLSGVTVGQIESYGAMTVNLTDSAGNALNLASGKSATIRIPLSSRAASPLASMPLYYVSAETGRWVQGGTATLQGAAPNQYYEGTVTHFSTWNADYLYQSVLVTGCVNDQNGVAAAGVTVMSDGIDYSGSSSATTNSAGQFSIKIKTSGRATLGGVLDGMTTNVVTAGPSAVDFSVTPCLQLSNSSLRVKLTWGTLPYDVDSYMTLPTGEVVYYGHRGSLLAAPYTNLDVDDTTSFGPEVVTVSKLMVGTYHYAVRNYSATYAPGIMGSPTKVELTYGSNTAIYAPPAGEPTSGKSVWSVFDFAVAANCSVTVTPVNTWSSVEPTSPGTLGTPVYCVAP